MTHDPHLTRKKWRFSILAGLLACTILGTLWLGLLAARAGQTELSQLWTRLALITFGLFLLLVFVHLFRSVQLEQVLFEPPFQLSALGFGFFALLAVVGVLAFSTGNNLFYLLFSVLSAALLVSVAANKLSLTKLDVDISAPAHIFAAEPVPLELTLTNRKRLLPSFSLLVTLDRRRRNWRAEEIVARLAHFAILPPRAQARVTVSHMFAQRGVYPLHGLSVRTRFPFGLVERQASLMDAGELIVYPPLRPLANFTVTPLLETGARASRWRGQGDDLYALRAYQPGDLRHAIDWKATAKTAQLMVREFTRAEEWRVLIALDTDLPAPDVTAKTAPDASIGKPLRPGRRARRTQAAAATEAALAQQQEQFEQAIQFAASLLDDLLARGAAVSLWTPDSATDYDTGRPHAYRLLRELARLTPGSATARAANNETSLIERLERDWDEDGAGILLTITPRHQVPAQLREIMQIVTFAELSEQPSRLSVDGNDA